MKLVEIKLYLISYIGKLGGVRQYGVRALKKTAG